MPPLIKIIWLSAEALPYDGAPHLANQPNPITLAAADQSERLDVIMLLSASPTRSLIVLLPSGSEEEVDIDGTEGMIPGVEEEPPMLCI